MMSLAVWAGDSVAALTYNKGNHGRSVATGSFEPFDEFFDLPDLDVLFGFIWLWSTHIDKLADQRRPAREREFSRLKEDADRRPEARWKHNRS